MQSSSAQYSRAQFSTVQTNKKRKKKKMATTMAEMDRVRGK
jgi:hypothetical protein